MVNYDDWANFKANYYRQPEPRQLRLGQAFLNRWGGNTTHPELYYEEDDGKAIGIIEAQYINWECD